MLYFETPTKLVLDPPTCRNLELLEINPGLSQFGSQTISHQNYLNSLVLLSISYELSAICYDL